MRNGKEFWKHIDMLLKEKGLLYKDICLAIGLTASYVSTWKIRGTIPLEYLDKISDLFGCSIDALLRTDLRYKDANAIIDGHVAFQCIGKRVCNDPWDSDLKSMDIDVARRLSKGRDSEDLVAIEVMDDSMIGSSFGDGDVVVFARNVVSGNGIYVISIDGEVFIRRLAWNPISKVVTIMSDNPTYEPMQISSNDERFAILGKVTGWLHSV